MRSSHTIISHVPEQSKIPEFLKLSKIKKDNPLNTLKYIKTPVMALGLMISSYFAIQAVISGTQLMWLGGTDKKTLFLNISFLALSVITSALFALLVRASGKPEYEESNEEGFTDEEGDEEAFEDVSDVDRNQGN